MSTPQSATRGVALRANAPSQSDAFLAPLQTIGVLEPASVPAPGRRPRTNGARARTSAASWRWLPRWLRGKEPAPEPQAPQSALTPAAAVNQADLVRQLLTALADLSHGRVPKRSAEDLVTEINKFPRPEGQDDDFEYVTYQPSPDRRFHRLTVRRVRLVSGEGKLDALDISGIDANVALRLENCMIDILDVSHARLHSLDLKGCRPGAGSPLEPWGMRVFARELCVHDNFMIGQGDQPSRILMLDASSITAREIQILEGTEFKGGQLARKIWDRLIERLEAHPDQPADDGKESDPLADLDAASLIVLHTVAARDVLRTLALYSVKTDIVIISVKSCGIIDLHDAEVRTQVLIDADFENKIENLDPLKPTVTEALRQKLGDEDTKLLEKTALYLSGRLSPCLDLAGVHCKGEIRFDGPEPAETEKEEHARLREAPPVRGHIALANAHCRVFTDDGTWLFYATNTNVKDARKRLLTFGLSSFQYEYFGQSSRLLSDTDPEFERHLSLDRPRKPFTHRDSIVEGTIERQRRRMIGVGLTALLTTPRGALPNGHFSSGSGPQPVDMANPGHKTDRFESSSIKVIGIDKELVRQKHAWLKAALPPDEDDDIPKALREQFDAQPWTHCVAVLRRAGWRVDVSDILFDREDEIHKARLQPRSGIWAYGAFSFLVFLGSAGLYQTALNEPVPLPDWAFVSASPTKPIVVTMLVAAAVLLMGSWGRRESGAEQGRNERKYSLLESLWYRLLSITFGYGFKSENALIGSLAIIVLGAGIFLFAHSTNLLIVNPASNNAGVSSRGSSGGGAKPAQEAALELPQTLREAHDGLHLAAPLFLPASERSYLDCPGQDDAICRGEQTHPGAPEKPNATPIPQTTPPTNTRGDVNVTVTQTIVRQKEGEGKFPSFNALMYSVDVFIPLIDFSQGSYWVPGFNGGKLPCSGTKEPVFGDHLLLFGVWVFYWFLVAAGWWFTSIVVFTLAGVLDRKE